MIRLTCAAIYLICSMTMGANAGGYASGTEIQSACAKPMPQVVTKELAAHLAKARNALSSLPKITCAAVLFGDTRDRVLTFVPAPDKSYFVTRTESPGRKRASFEMGQTPVNFARRLRGGWQIRRWMFENAKFSISPKTVLKFRRIDAKPKGKGNTDTQTIRVLKVFPIRQDGKLRDRLFVLLDDWGKWRKPGAPPERKWLVYSERANAVLMHSILYVKGGNSRKWDATNVRFIGYLTRGRWNLAIKAKELAPLRAYLKKLDLWSVP